jgi:hypothetical protein
MKLFPTKTYEFEIANDYSKTLSELKKTLISQKRSFQNGQKKCSLVK